MTIAITGATGHFGRIAVARLKARVAASDIVALARTPAKAADLGVPVRAADYAQGGTLGAALAGVDSLLLVSSSEVGQRAAQHRNVIEAAKAAGVRHIVYTSLLHADTSTLPVLPAEHLETEALVKASGIPWTILRNGWYVENHTGSLKGALAAGALLGSAGNGRLSSATRADYAEAAVAVLTGTGHAGRSYELAADDAFTLADLAAELSRQSGKAIPYRNLPEAEYAAALAGMGLPGPIAGLLAAWDVAAAGGALFDDARVLGRLIGRPTTPLAAAVAAALK